MVGLSTWIYGGLGLLVGFAVLIFLGVLIFAAIVKLRGASAAPILGPAAPDPNSDAAMLLSIVDKGRLAGAAAALDAMKEFEAAAFKGRLADAFGPKAPPPAAK